jgi:hypothetical protein
LKQRLRVLKRRHHSSSCSPFVVEPRPVVSRAPRHRGLPARFLTSYRRSGVASCLTVKKKYGPVIFFNQGLPVPALWDRFPRFWTGSLAPTTGSRGPTTGTRALDRQSLRSSPHYSADPSAPPPRLDRRFSQAGPPLPLVRPPRSWASESSTNAQDRWFLAVPG